jgi:hypothetical protein
MSPNIDIAISTVTGPDIFRHTPFEHETTTDASALLTITEGIVVNTQQQVSTERPVLSPAMLTQQSK